MKSVVYIYALKKSAGLYDAFGSGSHGDTYFFQNLSLKMGRTLQLRAIHPYESLMF